MTRSLCPCFLHLAELFNECYHNSEERAFALLVRKSQYWSKTTCLQLATEADAKSFFAHDGVQVSLPDPSLTTSIPRAFKARCWTQKKIAEQPTIPMQCIPLRDAGQQGDSALSLVPHEGDIIPHPSYGGTVPLSPPSLQLGHRPVPQGVRSALIPPRACSSLLAQREASGKHFKSA